MGSFTYLWDGDQSCGGNVGGGTLTADMADPYAWSLMPDSCNAGCSDAQRAALAEFCYELGVSSRADYGNCGTAMTVAS